VLGVVGVSILGVVFTIQSGDGRWLFFGLPFTVVLFVMGRYAPSGYRLGADGVHVERRAGPVVIPYATIRTADAEPRPVGGLTLLGSRGVFGRFGRFWSPRLGHHRLFLTNTDTVVWLATDGGWVGLSPERPAEFLERLHTRLGR
jgi:hypothetical protein